MEYSISALGARLAPILEAMHQWGLELEDVADAGEPNGQDGASLAGAALLETASA